MMKSLNIWLKSKLLKLYIQCNILTISQLLIHVDTL